MSSEPAVRAVGLGKCYELYRQPQDRLKQILARGRRRYYREFWALRDVSFEIPRGGTLGIVGRNGSGKSTLLQLVAGTLAASAGSVEVRGRIAPLLELGTGFNSRVQRPRERLSQRRAARPLQDEIGARFDAIARFADIGEFIDQPVKVYSSGMHVRLAFAVATAVEPEVFILDEALAVGDARFQLACYERIQRMLDNGTTLLFVSHDGNAVKRLCERCLVLEAGPGRLRRRAEPGAQRLQPHPLRARHAAHAADPRERANVPPPHDVHAGADTLAKEYRYGSGKGRITSIALLDADGTASLLFETGTRVVVRCTVEVEQPVARPVFALRIKNDRGVEVYGTNTHFQGQTLPPLDPGARLTVEFTQEMVLMAGSYFSPSRSSSWSAKRSSRSTAATTCSSSASPPSTAASASPTCARRSPSGRRPATRTEPRAMPAVEIEALRLLAMIRRRPWRAVVAAEARRDPDRFGAITGRKAPPR
jgi:ABC-type polysaccharide/polyol phosphate transport system ATPase subunit